MLAFLSAIVFCGCAHPTISGSVADQDGKPQKAVKVDVAGTTLSALTDDAGHYAVPYVPGSVRVSVTKDGYVPVTRSYEIAQATTYPAAPVVLYPYAPGAALSWLGAGKVEAVEAVNAVVDNPSGKSGFPSQPDLQIPSDVWGFVFVPHSGYDSDNGSALMTGLAAQGGEAPEIALYRMTWKARLPPNNWQYGFSMALWVADKRVDVAVSPSDPLSPAGWIVRPRSSLDDGVYALTLRGNLTWPFRVGTVAQQAPQIEEAQGG